MEKGLISGTCQRYSADKRQIRAAFDMSITFHLMPNPRSSCDVQRGFRHKSP